MKCVLINPNIVSQVKDFSGTGIPYLPIGLAYLASYLRQLGYIVKVIDAFGEAPYKISRSGDKLVQGLDVEQVVSLIPSDSDVIFMYAHLIVTFQAQIILLERIRQKFNAIPIIVLENINKVTSYSLLPVKDYYFKRGVDYLVLGYLEHKTARLLELLSSNIRGPEKLRKIPGIVFKNGSTYEVNLGLEEDWRINLDFLPFPAWDLFPLKNYWDIKYAHGPFTTKRYLALLSSRGCPFDCNFCVSNGMVSNRKWNPRSPKNVVDEIITFREHFNVSEFHFEDLNPGVSKKRLIDFCDELLRRGVKIQWKFAQGTKLEYLDEDIIKKMSEAGCKYISISPESGSTKLLASINKTVDLDHSLRVVKWLKKYDIISQGCYIIGLPNETNRDLKLTKRHLLRLAKIGLDDPAIFIITPMPGSRCAEAYSNNLPMPDQCTFSPTWRKDYYHLARFRQIAYIEYIIIKIIYHPKNFVRYLTNFITRKFQTKVEMTIYRKMYSLIFFIKGNLRWTKKY